MSCLDALDHFRTELVRQRCADALDKDDKLTMAHALLSQASISPTVQKKHIAAAKESPRTLSEGERLFIDGLVALAEDQRQVAKAVFEALVTQLPGDKRAYYYRGLLRYRFGDLDGAQADFRKAIELDEKFGPAHNALGHLLLRRDAVDEAQKEFAKYVELHPKEANALDSHVVLPAVGAVESGCFVGALGTSAVSLLLSETFRPLPKGIEGVARDGAIPGLWCYEAGQASFGDTLSWLVRTFPRGATVEESFAAYDADARALAPGDNRLVALDWWNGNRVPYGDSMLSGLLAGLTLETTAGDIYRALIEGLCYGMRQVFELYQAGGFDIGRVVMTSGLARRNTLLVQIMADVLGRDVEVPEIDNATAVGAAIHGAVAAGIVADFVEGSARFGARGSRRYRPDPVARPVYDRLYGQYRTLSGSADVARATKALSSEPDADEAGLRIVVT